MYYVPEDRNQNVCSDTNKFKTNFYMTNILLEAICMASEAAEPASEAI